MHPYRVELTLCLPKDVKNITFQLFASLVKLAQLINKLMVISMCFIRIDILQYILGRFKIVRGLKAPKLTQNMEIFSDFDQNESHVLVLHRQYMV